MKKNQTMQGTFSKLFGKKHAHPSTTSLYATNPPWIFTQEAQEEGTRDFGECTGAGKKKKKKGEFPVAPPGSLLALASLGRWESGQEQGRVGTCGPAEEMLGRGRRRGSPSQRGAGNP